MLHNVQYTKRIKLSSWRKISVGSWRPNGDSSLFIEQKIRMEPILDFLKSINQNQDQNQKVKISLNHVFSKIFGLLLRKHPEFNVVVRPLGLYQRAEVDTFFHVVQNATGANLSGLVVRSADRKKLAEIAEDFEGQIKRIRGGEDIMFDRVKNIYRIIPSFLSKFVLDVTGFICYALNIKMTSLGMPQDPFGSLMITNVGSLGIEGGYTVIAPYSRIPMVVGLCAVKSEPVVSDAGELEVGKVMTLALTIDHRIVDGFHIANLLRSLKEIVSQPSQYLGSEV